ncbi:hypothetical protein ACFQ2K_05025 [Streptomyces sanglieri]|uniref:Uncharacterized protein n=1 Tax=Streptomyces sanglieri TaxID=193460 RepID=A0ABW2WLG6_9ACTN
MARTAVEVAGARITEGDRLAVLLDAGPGAATAPAHRALAPFHHALAETALAALANRYTRVRPTTPVVRRARAPLTRGPARVRVRATPITATGRAATTASAPAGTTTPTTAGRRTTATTTPTAPPRATGSPAAAAALGARRGEAR